RAVGRHRRAQGKCRSAAARDVGQAGARHDRRARRAQRRRHRGCVRRRSRRDRARAAARRRARSPRATGFSGARSRRHAARVPQRAPRARDRRRGGPAPARRRSDAARARDRGLARERRRALPHAGAVGALMVADRGAVRIADGRELLPEDVRPELQASAATFALLVRSLCADAAWLAEHETTLTGWAERFVALIDAYLTARDDDAARDLERVRATLASL